MKSPLHAATLLGEAGGARRRQSLEPPISPTYPAGRPYSPYPYRDLPSTPDEWESHFQPSATNSIQSGCPREFSLFPYLPAELRVRVWQQAILSACEHPRVHWIRLSLRTQSPAEDVPDIDGNEVEIIPTTRLSESTFAVRSLLSTCIESRRESLSLLDALHPDVLPVSENGVIRCNLSRDMLVISDISPTTLLALIRRQLQHHHQQSTLLTSNHSLPSFLPGVRHLGLDLASHLQDDPTGLSPIPPDLESALVTVAASLPNLEQLYLLQPPSAPASSPLTVDQRTKSEPTVFLSATQPSPSSKPPSRGGLGRQPPPEHLFLSSSSNNLPSDAPIHHASSGEWYSTRALPRSRVRSDYYVHLRLLVRALCQLRSALRDVPTAAGDVVGDEPAESEEGDVNLGTDSGNDGGVPQGNPASGLGNDMEEQEEEEAENAEVGQAPAGRPSTATMTPETAERLSRIKVRALGHYVAFPDASSPVEEGDNGGVREGKEDWHLSSPETCLEMALGNEPKWVQWEWVCQCLDV
jgi:hypothetical protein